MRRKTTRGLLPLSQKELRSRLRHRIASIDAEIKQEMETLIGRMKQRIGRQPTQYAGPANPHTEFYQRVLRRDSFSFLPMDLRDLQIVGSKRTKGSVRRRGLPSTDVTLLTAWPGCQYAVVHRPEFGGHPVEPEEVDVGLPSWPPVRYAWAQPQLGRLELVCSTSINQPGQTQSGGFGYTTASGHITAALPLFLSEPTTVKISAIPYLSGLVALGGSGALNDVAGFAVSLQLSAVALRSGSSQSTIAPVASNAGVGAFLPFVESFRNRALPVSVAISVSAPDFVLIVLTLLATVFQQGGSYGYSLVDIDGLTSPPGRSAYFAEGALQVSFFAVSDPSCVDPLTR